VDVPALFGEDGLGGERLARGRHFEDGRFGSEEEVGREGLEASVEGDERSDEGGEEEVSRLV
jgi:hypothetical protein